MTRVSLSTALATLWMFCGAGNALASTVQQKTMSADRGVTTKNSAESIDLAGRQMSVTPSMDIGGLLMSHAWFAFRDNYYFGKGVKQGSFLTSDQLRTHGISTDAMLHLTAEGKNDSLGIYYGGSIELEAPYSQNADYTSFRQISNRGTKVYLNTEYGDFGFGYQVGIDSIMRIDAFSIAAGDNSNTWLRYVNLRGIHDPLKVPSGGVSLPVVLRQKYLENVFYLSTGLYSEGLLDGGNRFSVRNSAQSDNENAARLVNSLPLRFSYLSPSFAGLKLGVSYAPYGQDEDMTLQTHSVTEKKRIAVLDRRYLVPPLAPRGTELYLPISERLVGQRSIMPMYEHIVNVGMTYSSYFNGLNFKLSMVSEYARNKTRLLRPSFAADGWAFPKMDSIKNVALGGMLKYKSIKFAVSYGYLGRIDKISNMYYWKSDKYVLDTADAVIINTDGTYFWTIGGGYEYSGLYVSATYRGSNYSGNRFDEISFGAEYDISGSVSKVKCKVFANYHNFAALSSIVAYPADTDGSNRGQVLLAGMKVKF